MEHTRLWDALASTYPSLLAVTNGLRILSTVLAVAILIYWTPSTWRCVRDKALEGDAHRAGWVPLAIAVLAFQARWFVPYVSDLNRGRMLVVAHGTMAMALMFGIYVHGRREGGLRIRRAMLAHTVMLVLCVAVSAVLK
jgi:hypothetical protein